MLQFFLKKKAVVPRAICGIRIVTNGLALLLMAAVIAKFMVCDHGHVSATSVWYIVPSEVLLGCNGKLSVLSKRANGLFN